MNNRKGFTLVEVIVILAVLSIIAGIATPAALRIFQVIAEEGTRDEMLNLREAMIGNPEKLRGRARSDFSFLGDIGRLPTNLDEILVKGPLPAFTFDNTKQTGAGWNGPYITGSFAGEEPEDFKNDQLGNAYVYSDTDFTNSNGELADGKITSAGPDGTIGTADDIVIEILKNETEGTIRGTVTDSGGKGLSGIDIDLNFASNGSLSTVTATTDADGNFAFTSVPFGPRSVVEGRPDDLILVDGSVKVEGGENVEFKVNNFSASNVVLTSLQAVYSDLGRFEEVEVDGTEVAEGTFFSSTTVPFSPSATIAAASGTSRPLKVFVDAPEVVLPDIVTATTPSELKIELKDFQNDIRGVSFTVTFSEGSVVSFTTPN